MPYLWKSSLIKYKQATNVKSSAKSVANPNPESPKYLPKTIDENINNKEFKTMNIDNLIWWFIDNKKAFGICTEPPIAE